MSGNFEKFKKRYLRTAIIKSVACGVFFGLFAAGVLLLILKLTSVNLHWALYALVGIAAGAIAGGLCFLIIRPDDKRTAKKLDSDYNLKEKVQTMVAFREQESVMLAMQRADAESALGAVTAKRVGFGEIWQYLLIALLALVMFVTALVVPAKRSATDGKKPNGGGDTPQDPPFRYDIWLKNSLDELIVDVSERSELHAVGSDEIRDGIVAELTALDTELAEIDKFSVMKTAVIGAVIDIDALVYGYNSYTLIASAVAELHPELSTSVVRGGLAYTSFGRLVRVEIINDYYANSLTEKVEERLVRGFGEDRKKLDFETQSGLAELLDIYVASIDSAFDGISVKESDALRTAFTAHRDTLAGIKPKANENFGVPTLKSDIEKAFEKFSAETAAALTVQNYNRMVNVFVRERLVEIFGLSLSDLPALGDSDIGDEGDDDNNGGGGYGDGDEKYGSDDTVFDPDRAAIVKYGDILLSEKYPIVMERLRDDTLPDDVKKFISDYFNILISGLDEDGEN